MHNAYIIGDIKTKWVGDTHYWRNDYTETCTLHQLKP